MCIMPSRFHGRIWSRPRSALYGPAPANVRVYNAEGTEVPSQLTGREGGEATVVFLAAVAPTGCAVFDVRPSFGPCTIGTGLRARAQAAPQAGAQPRINRACRPAPVPGRSSRTAATSSGSTAKATSPRSTTNGTAPAPLRSGRTAVPRRRTVRLGRLGIDFDDLMAPPRTVSAGPASIRVVEDGPARVTVEIVREVEGSTIRRRVSLGAGGSGDRLEVAATLDWRTPGTLLTAAFPLAVHSERAVYDLGAGTVVRGVNAPNLYEVPAQKWADVTADDGSYGVAVLNDCRYGWDRPDEGTLRLTLIHTPAVNDRWQWVRDQASQDLGVHEVTWAVCGHAGDWREGGVAWQAERLNQPLRAFQVPAHDGTPRSRVLPAPGGDPGCRRGFGERRSVRVGPPRGPGNGRFVARRRARHRARQVRNRRGFEFLPRGGRPGREAGRRGR